MQYFFKALLATLAPLVLLTPASALSPEAAPLVKSYELWRTAMIKKDVRLWEAATSRVRKQELKNMIYSERRAFPTALFAQPFQPPAARSLTLLQAKVSGTRAKSVFFGKIDFGVGGDPTKNLLVVSSLKEGSTWKFEAAEYVNLSALKEVRSQLQSGNLSYLSQPDFLPQATPKPAPLIALKGPVQTIAKVYAYCPGREVQTIVNKRSRHLFQNAKEAEIVIGGGLGGRNEVQFAIKRLPGSTGKEPLCLRVYLLSQVRGVKPIKIYEYLVEEGGSPKPYGTEYFTVEPSTLKILRGATR